MSTELMSKAVAASLKTDLPDFEIGDTVNVSVRIIEGEKERVQVFTGIVISRKGTGIHETFTVRRIIAGEGVERTFPLNSPRVAGVEVIRKSHVRRAKLYFLRKRIGKATVLREKRRTLTQVPGAEQAAVDQAPTEQTTEA